jgi:hypothetical protein
VEAGPVPEGAPVALADVVEHALTHYSDVLESAISEHPVNPDDSDGDEPC